MNSINLLTNDVQRDYAAIIDVLKKLDEGLYKCDISLLASVFHPNAQYFTASSGELTHLDMETYFPIVKQRTSPESSGVPHKFSIDSIEFLGPVTAIARMRSSMFSKNFIDSLTLARINDSWKIIVKVFHSEQQAAIETDI